MRNLFRTLQLVYRCDRGAFLRRLLYVVLQSLLPLANIYVLKLLIDSVETSLHLGNGLEIVVPLLVAMCLLFLFNRCLGALYSVNNDYLTQRLIDYMSDLMQRQAARLDMAYYDNPAYHDTFHRAQQEASYRPLQVLNSSMAVLGAAVSLAGVAVMLLLTSWWIVVVMVLAVVPGFAIRLRKARTVYRFRKENTQLYRRTTYYGALLSAREFAKEVRVYRLVPFFRQRFVEARQKLSARLLAISKRIGALDIVCALVEAAAMLAVVWMLVARTYSRAITIGTFVMLFEAFRRGQGYLGNLAAAVANLYDNRLFIGNLFEFLSLEPHIVDVPSPQTMPDDIESIEFREVTFRYPGMNRDVLHRFSLTARRGELTVVEGRNGYGKSTLVKLLLRLYDPQEGSVLVNGIDIRQLSITALRERISTVFQDFVRYNCTAGEALTFGNLCPVPPGSDPADSLADFVADLPQGYDTPLGRMFDEGAELSMGQWQRLAIARVLRSGAPVMVLDEPMAWLDAEARQRLASQLDTLKQNHIIIMINHV